VRWFKKRKSDRVVELLVEACRIAEADVVDDVMIAVIGWDEEIRDEAHGICMEEGIFW
jgi:hypothetical protein